MSRRAAGGIVAALFAAVAAAGWCAAATTGDAPEVRRVDGVPAGGVNCLAADGDSVWVGMADGTIARVDGSGRVLDTFGKGRGLPPARTLSLAVYRGRTYAGTEDGLAVFDGASWATTRREGTVVLKNVYLRAEPKDAGLWACAVDLAGGLLRFDGERWRFQGGRNRGLLNHVQAFAFRDGETWLGSSTSGVYRFSGDAFDRFRAADGLPSSNVISLETFDGTVWAGTSTGLARFDGKRWTPFTIANGFPLRAVFCMTASPGVLYLGGREGLARFRSGRFELFAQEGVSLGRVNALLVSGNALYAGTSRGLFLVTGW